MRAILRRLAGCNRQLAWRGRRPWRRGRAPACWFGRCGAFFHRSAVNQQPPRSEAESAASRSIARGSRPVHDADRVGGDVAQELSGRNHQYVSFSLSAPALASLTAAETRPDVGAGETLLPRRALTSPPPRRCRPAAMCAESRPPGRPPARRFPPPFSAESRAGRQPLEHQLTPPGCFFFFVRPVGGLAAENWRDRESALLDQLADDARHDGSVVERDALPVDSSASSPPSGLRMVSSRSASWRAWRPS